MDWTVVWVPDAEQELARLWLNAADRDHITLASAEILKDNFATIRKLQASRVRPDGES